MQHQIMIYGTYPRNRQTLARRRRAMRNLYRRMVYRCIVLLYMAAIAAFAFAVTLATLCMLVCWS